MAYTHWTPARIEQLRELASKGSSYSGIAVEMGSNKHTVRRRCLQFGVSTAPRMDAREYARQHGYSHKMVYLVGIQRLRAMSDEMRELCMKNMVPHHFEPIRVTKVKPAVKKLPRSRKVVESAERIERMLGLLKRVA